MNIAYYLSANNQTTITAGDTPLATVVNRPLSIAAGKSQAITASVIIPKTPVGTYYIKAMISSGSQAPVSLANGNVIVASPALNEYDAGAMYPGTAPIYEKAVAAVKAAPDLVPAEFKAGFGDPQIQAYIKDNEGLSFTPYIDSQGVPTIGYGFNLQNPGAAARMAAIGLNYNLVLQQAALNKGQINASGGYNATIKQKVTLAVAEGWFDADYPAAKAKLIPALNSVGITAAAFNNLAATTKVVLIDMYYNMGSNFINGPAGKSFPKMLAFLKAGNLAAAGFELLDSQYATQVGARAVKNFDLLVYGQAAKL